MKKLISINIVAMLSALAAYGQCNYQQSSNTVSIWDWRQEYYTDMYVIGENNPYSNGGFGVPNPFTPPTTGGTNVNLDKFYTQYATTNSIGSVDCQPDDGWELLAKEFGSAQSPVNTPFFCLYNRHTGIVRAFFLMVQTPSSTQNGAIVKMQHVLNAQSAQSAIFSHLFPITNPVENFIKGGIMASPNYYVSQKGYWMYGDFPMAYDPCVCYYQSKIIFEIETSQQMSITLDADINGYFNQIIASTGGNVSNKENIFDVAGNIFRSGNKSYDSWKKSVDEIDKFANKQEIDLRNQILFGTVNMRNLLTTIPYLGAAFGVLDYFQSLNQSSKASPMNFGANLQFTGNGNIMQRNSYGTFTYWTPGSNQSAQTEKTIYDNPLGVVSFLKPITVDYVDYYNRANGGLIFPPIRQYKIAEAVKYALNPSANIEVTDIQASLVIKYRPMPIRVFDRHLNTGGGYGVFFPRPVGFAYTPNFMDKVASVGMETEMFAYNTKRDSVMVSIRTPYVPLSCFENVSIFLHRQLDNSEADPDNNTYLGMAVKFIIKGRVKGPTGEATGKEVVFLQTYFITEQRSSFDDGGNSHRWEEGDGQFPTFNSQNGNAPAMDAPFALAEIDKTIANTSVSNGSSVMRSLILGANLSVSSSSPIEFRAGHEIIVDQQTYIGEETTLTIGLPNVNCSFDIEAMRFTEPEINDFCTSTAYKEHFLTKRGEEEQSTTKEQLSEADPFVALNPFTTTLDFSYNLKENSHVVVRLISISGSEVYRNDLAYQVAGAHRETLDVSGVILPVGLYILEIQTPNNVIRKKLIKQ